LHVETAQARQGDAFTEACKGAKCRACSHRGLKPVLDLGKMPLADRLPPVGSTELEPRYPLELAFCPNCSLVQILTTVAPEVVFDADYPYFSSYSETWLAHSRSHAISLIQERGLNSQSLVIELASNDGYLLRTFVEHGVPVLGIDPAPGPARAAQERGVRTMCAFFTLELAEQLRAEGTLADVVIGKNVLAHVADTNGFVEGISRILKPGGVAVVEMPYVRDLIEHTEFDTIYHEHLCYFSITSARKLFANHGLELVGAERLLLHGGSLRLTFQAGAKMPASVRAMLEEEERAGVLAEEFYSDFAGRARTVAEGLRELVLELRRQGRSVASYGAAAKGAVMLNYAGLDHSVIDFVVDRNPHKQGRMMPGLRIPILPPSALLEQRPDDTIILPWNIKDEIMAQQQEYRSRGGRFIIPIPSPAVV
jgi:SAM-dependent methyltransferase